MIGLMNKLYTLKVPQRLTAIGPFGDRTHTDFDCEELFMVFEERPDGLVGAMTGAGMVVLKMSDLEESK